MAGSELNRSGIYQIRNIKTGKRYVGSALNIRKRWEVHKSELRAERHHSQALQRSWLKHGEDVFVLEVLEYIVTVEELLAAEQRWLDMSNCVAPHGYNVQPSAMSNLGRKFGATARANMSSAAKGRKHTDESKARIAAGARRPCSDETKAKISASNRGKKRSPELKASMTGRTMSPEARAKLSAAGTGRIVSDETRQKLSAARKGRSKTPEHSEKIRQALLAKRRN